MESPVVHPESPMDGEDVPFPCMGCGEILEEGKAFELSGQRWHIDCFRCSTCNTLLDSDAHLLLLGDGSLICSNCTYSCNSCGNKIEDLAILTGDQAFCAQCFRCRNCKKKIENLRYARTSQGIFCMDCHESLMQRRRKKKANAAAAKRPGGPGVKLDKSLPSLPPNMEETRSIDETPSESYAEAVDNRVDATPPEQHAADDNLLLPSSTYRSSRHLGAQRENNSADAGGELLIPLAFDPSESQRSSSRAQSQAPPQEQLPHDYFDQVRSGDSSVRASRDGHYSLEPPSRASTENPSPHIAYQEKGWEQNDEEQARRDTEALNGSAKEFTDSMDATLSKIGRSESARNSRYDLPLSIREKSAFSGATSPESVRSKEATAEPRSVPQEPAVRPSNELHRLHDHGSMESARSQQSAAYPPKRGDSLESKHHQIPRKEVGASPASSAYGGSPKLDGAAPEPPKHQHMNTSVRAPIFDAQQNLDGAGSPFMAGYPGCESPVDRGHQPHDSFFRRFSRPFSYRGSVSDRGLGNGHGKEGKVPKSPANSSSAGLEGSFGGMEIASPTTSTSQADEISSLRKEIRKQRERIVEMENALRATSDVKQVNTELSEKRSTMVVLDAKREITMRELKVLTDHIEAEKRGGSGQPLDLAKLSNHVLRDLAESIHKLKETYTPEIEELIQKRNDLNEQLVDLTRQKEKSFQEFEQLSSKNAELAELNNQLVHSIQSMYKNNPDGQRNTPGLGISHNKGGSVPSIEAMKPTMNEFPTSVSTAHIGDEGEPATAQVVPAGPQVVSIRKGQPRKFNWKKGGQNVAKGVKGLKGAFMSSEAQEASGGLPRSQTQDPSRQGFGFFGNQRNKQGGKMSQADSVPVLAENSGTTLFGTDLEARMEHEKSIIPGIVSRCIQEVELRGMDMEGIYRKSGAASAIQTIREGFERSPFDHDISDPDLDIHAVTSALKQYFRKLPTPLITFDVYDTIIDSGEISNTAARVELLRSNLQQLPRVHRDVLEFLIFHLKRVVERQKENLMTSQNVAVVFAPTIMRPESLAREMTDVQKKNDVLKFLVENCQDIFMDTQG
ncbi:hypothetical protein N7532_005788 [Penicillium argentinense]|uniref:Rho GTPase activator Rga n=1 Tax=Penicillium argentinense TaxID=1131581 RepID=A0A9W9FEL9_9EURO|nr:uncharacterized protein N7532_005788 [Penicillium argentinense]KAJ5098787.1 hypothetical protein N7532_005788 [Penicillium argentinense]